MLAALRAPATLEAIGEVEAKVGVSFRSSVVLNRLTWLQK
jgi:hypothetical protein